MEYLITSLPREIAPRLAPEQFNCDKSIVAACHPVFMSVEEEITNVITTAQYKDHWKNRNEMI